MVQKSHAELEREHYRLVITNPDYRLAGQLECQREDIMMHLPYISFQPCPPPEGRICDPATEGQRVAVHITKRLDYLKGLVLSLQDKLNEHLDKKGKNEGKEQPF